MTVVLTPRDETGVVDVGLDAERAGSVPADGDVLFHRVVLRELPRGLEALAWGADEG